MSLVDDAAQRVVDAAEAAAYEPGLDWRLPEPVVEAIRKQVVEEIETAVDDQTIALGH